MYNILYYNPILYILCTISYTTILYYISYACYTTHPMHYTFHTPLLRTIHLILYDNPILYILCIAPSIYLYTTRNASHNPIFYIVCTTHPTHPSIHTQAQTLKHTHSSTHTRAHTHSSIHKRCSPQMCIDPAQVFCASLPPWSRRPRGDRPREQGVWCVCACVSVCT